MFVKFPSGLLSADKKQKKNNNGDDLESKQACSEFRFSLPTCDIIMCFNKQRKRVIRSTDGLVVSVCDCLTELGLVHACGCAE